MCYNVKEELGKANLHAEFSNLYFGGVVEALGGGVEARNLAGM